MSLILPKAVFISAYASTSQANALASTSVAQVVLFDTVADSFGMTALNSSSVASSPYQRFTFPQVGDYLVSIALASSVSTGGPQSMGFWLRYGNVSPLTSSNDIAYSNNFDTLASSTPLNIARTYQVECVTAGDFIEVWWSGSSTNISIAGTAAGGSPVSPAAPGIALVAHQIGATGS